MWSIGLRFLKNRDKQSTEKVDFHGLLLVSVRVLNRDKKCINYVEKEKCC